MTRGQSGAVSRQFGVAGLLIGMALAGFQCVKCGSIPKNEFPPDVRSQMARGSVTMVVIGVAVLGAAIAVVVALNS